jgi:hypothetical protein
MSVLNCNLSSTLISKKLPGTAISIAKKHHISAVWRRCLTLNQCKLTQFTNYTVLTTQTTKMKITTLIRSSSVRQA